MKKKLPCTFWIGIAASAVMLVLFVLELLPYWSYQGESVSIAGYVLRPYEHSTFTTLFRSYFGKKYRITLMFGLPMFLNLAGNSAGAVLCALRSSRSTSYLVPIACGGLGLYALLAGQPYQLSSLWLPMVILYAMELVLGIAGIILALTKSKRPLRGS